MREGGHKQVLISSTKPVTVKVEQDARATVESASGQVLILESRQDGFEKEDRIPAGKLRPMRQGRYTVLLPPQK